MANQRLWTLLVIASAATGCASDAALEIRPIGRQDSAVGQPASVRLALAQGHMALGNVALALEEFRRAEREQPGNAAALAGMANCYRHMGRLDLSRRYYEQALAVAPTEPSLYLALANALDEGGQGAAAQSVRTEVAARVAERATPVTTAAGSLATLPVPAPTPAAVPIAAPAEPPRTASVTVILAPARPLEKAQPAARLERLSSGEVALVTSGRSPWAARQLAAGPRSVKVQYERRDTMVVLNAARVAGIAARTRDYLASRGFAGARIGDAPTTRAQTLIRFPAMARARALRIAAQFPFAPRLEARDGPLTLIIGRDAAAKKAGRIG